MRGIWLENGKLKVRGDLSQPEPRSDEVLVRVTTAGICSTDLEIVKGYVPGFKGILGHEFVGVVDSVGANVSADWVGQRVTGTINIGCRTCTQCLAEGAEHCPNRTVLGIINRDGIFAEYVTLPEANLVSIPDSVPDEVAVFTEPLAAALRIRDQVMVLPSRPICVIGPGRLGMLIGKVLAEAGTEVTMAGRRAESLALAADWGLKTALVAEIDDNAFRFTVEATGNAAGLEHAIRITQPLGTIVLKSTFAGAPSINLTKVVVGELNIIGSRCGPFEPAVRLLAGRKISPEEMVEARYPLAEGLQAFEHAAKSGVRKILLEIS